MNRFYSRCVCVGGIGTLVFVFTHEQVSAVSLCIYKQYVGGGVINKNT